MENEDPYTFECMKLHVIPKPAEKHKKKRLSKSSIQNARCTIISSQTASRSETVQLSLNTVVKRHMAYTRVKYPFLLPSQIKGHALKELGLPNCMGDIRFGFGSKKSLCKAPWAKRLSVNSLAIFDFSQLLRNFLVTELEHQKQSYAGRKSNTLLQNISEASLEMLEVSTHDTGMNCLYAEKQASRATQRIPVCDLTSDDGNSNKNATFYPELAEDSSVASDSSQLSASHIHLLQQKLSITQCKTITVDKEIILDNFESSSKHLLFSSPKSVISLAEYKPKDEKDYMRTLKGVLSVPEYSAAVENEDHVSADESDTHDETSTNVMSDSTLIVPRRVREERDLHDEKYSDVSSVTSDSMLPWRVKSPAIHMFNKIADLCTDHFEELKISADLNSNVCNLFENLTVEETIPISEHSSEHLSDTEDETSSDANGRESLIEQLLSINGEEYPEVEDTDFETEPLHRSEILGVNEDSSSSDITSISASVHSPGKTSTSLVHSPGKTSTSLVHSPGKTSTSSVHFPGKTSTSSVHSPGKTSTSSIHSPGKTSTSSVHFPDKSKVPTGETSGAHFNTTSPGSSIEEVMSECHSDLGYNPSLSTISSVSEKETSKEEDMKSQSKLDHSRSLDVLNLRETPTNAADKIFAPDIQCSFKSQSSPEKQIQPSIPIKINQEVSTDSKLSEKCENTAVEIQDTITGIPPVLMSENDMITSDDSNLTAIEKSNRDSAITTSISENNEANSDWESDAFLESIHDQVITEPQNSSFSKIQKNTVQLEKTQKKAYKVSIGIYDKKAKKQKVSVGVSTGKMSQTLKSNIKKQKEPTCKKSLDGEFSINKRAEQYVKKNQANALETKESINIEVSEGTPKISLQSSADNEHCENEEEICDEVTSKKVAPTRGKKNVQPKMSDAVYITELSPKQRTPLAELGVVTPGTSRQQALFKTPTSIQTCSKSRDPSDYEDGSNSEISDTHSLDQESIISDIAESLVSNVSGQQSISEKSYLIANTKFTKIVSTPNLKRKSKDNTGNDKLITKSMPKKTRITKDTEKKQECFQGDATSVKSEETDVDSLAKTRVCRISTVSRTSYVPQRATVFQSPTFHPLPLVDLDMSVNSEETDVDFVAKTRVPRISNVSRTSYDLRRTTAMQSPIMDPSTLPRVEPNLKVSRYLSGMTAGSSQESYLSSLDSLDTATPRLDQSLVAASECSTTSFLVNMFDPLQPQKIQKTGSKKNQTNKATKRAKATFK